MQIIQRTNVGNVREINEDTIGVVENLFGSKLLLVADGMGGHNAGEVASIIAKNIVIEEFLKTDDKTDYAKFIKTIIEKANHEIYTSSLINEGYSKMGTTLSLLIDTGERVYVGHIGDSRIYYIRDEKITQLTKDHTVVQSLYESGHIKKEDLKTHPYRNVLLQSLGTNKKVVINILDMKIPNRGYILLCSDGLTEDITDEDIRMILEKDEELEEKADELLKQVLETGGKDNVSFIIMERGI